MEGFKMQDTINLSPDLFFELMHMQKEEEFKPEKRIAPSSRDSYMDLNEIEVYDMMQDIRHNQLALAMKSVQDNDDWNCEFFCDVAMKIQEAMEAYIEED